MKNRIRTRHWLAGAVSFLMLVVAQSLIAAPPGGGGGGSKVSVTAANPPDAFQGQEIDVIVSGSGFDQGSQVSYLVTGTTDASQVEVLNVQFVSSTELRTRIRPKDAALPSEYDIEVRISSGRKGKGTTLFRVKVAETACTGDEPNEPTIVYLTEFDTSGDIYTADIYLSSASGCDQFLLVDDAFQFLPDSPQNAGVNRFIKSVSNVRLAVRDNLGVAAWLDSYQDPWVVMGIVFEWGADGSIVSVPGGPWQMFISPAGHDVVNADVKINEYAEVVLAMTEKSQDGSERLLSTYNEFTDEYEVISSGHCQVQDSFEVCYVPNLGSTRWSPAGNEIFFDPRNRYSGDDRNVIARMRQVANVWSAPQLVMELDPGHSSLSLGTISTTGLMAYRVDEEVTSRRGKLQGLRRADAIIDLAACEPIPCGSDDGVELPFPGINQNWIWTPTNGLLFREASGQTTVLREFNNPPTGETGGLYIEEASSFDSSL